MMVPTTMVESAVSSVARLMADALSCVAISLRRGLSCEPS